MENPMFFLSHFTDLKHLPKILEFRSILSPKKQRELLKEEWIPGICYNTAMGIGDIQRYDKSIFLEMITLRYNNLNPKSIYFIFTPEILADKTPIFSKGWNYGKLKENTYIEYNNKKSLEENLKDFDCLTSHSKDNRVEILVEDQISLDSNLFKIYIPEEILKTYSFQDFDFLKSKICSNFSDFLVI